MNSKAVNLVIRGEIRPALGDLGFNRSSTRTFWRDHPDRVDVVNFQSFNAYNASVLGVTTYSFAINLGCYLRYIPNPNLSVLARLEGDKPQPKEYECHMRGRLNRGYRDKACPNAEIWYIDPDASNVEKALQDARIALKRDALPWFEQFASPRSTYEILATQNEQMGRLWGFGRPGSPIRALYAGYAARACGLVDAARANLKHAAGTKSFVHIKEKILSDARGVV